MLNLFGLDSCGFPLPTISFIIIHDFGKFVLLNYNCSSMYYFSLFLRIEVNLLLNVVHSCLLSMVGFFSYACLRICLVLIDFRSAAVRYSNLFLYPIFIVFQENNFEVSMNFV